MEGNEHRPFAWALLVVALVLTACATVPPKSWVTLGGPEERARLTVEIALTLRHEGVKVQKISMPKATALLQGRVTHGKSPELQLAVVDVQIERPNLPDSGWTMYPPLTSKVKPRALGEEIDARDASFVHHQWTSALLIPGLVAIGRLPPAPDEGACAQVVLSELGRDGGSGGEDLFELELMLALLSGTMSVPPADAAADDPGRCRWRVAGQQGDVSVVTTLTALMTSPGPAVVRTRGVLKTLRTNSYFSDKAAVQAETRLRPGKLFPSEGHLTVWSEVPLPPKVTGGRIASYVYEITVRLTADPSS